MALAPEDELRPGPEVIPDAEFYQSENGLAGLAGDSSSVACWNQTTSAQGVHCCSVIYGGNEVKVITLRGLHYAPEVVNIG
jgi:hypothetical protein